MTDQPQDPLAPRVPKPVTIEDIARYLTEHAAQIDTFMVMAFPKPGESLPSVFEDATDEEQKAPSFAFFKIGTMERGMDQFDEFVRIHMEAMPSVVQAAQQRRARRIAEASVLVSPEGKPLLHGGH